MPDSMELKESNWSTRLIRWGVRLLAAYGAYHLASLCISSPAQPPQDMASAQISQIPQLSPDDPNLKAAAASAKPMHFYTMREGTEYGYEQAISDDEKRSGVSSKPLLLAHYLGKKDGEVTVIVATNNYDYSYVSCRHPCEFLHIKEFNRGMFAGEERLKNTFGSVIYDIMQDAMSGQLKLYAPANNKPAKVVVDTSLPEGAANETKQSEAEADK